jgi:hypothetical protein
MSGVARDTVTALRPAQQSAPAMAAAMAALRRLIERSSAGGKEGTKDIVPGPVAVESYRREIDALLEGPDGWTALERLCVGLALTPFERDLVLLCGAVQVNPTLLASTAGAVGGHPTFALAFALFCESSWAAMAPGGALHRYRLIVVEGAEFLLRASLRIDEVVLAYLLGGEGSDPRVRDLVERVPSPTFIPASHVTIAERIAALWRTRDPGTRPPVIQLSSDETAAPRAIAARACDLCGTALAMIRTGDVPAAGADRAGIARLWEREHAMSGSVLLIDVSDDSPETSRAALELAEALEAPLVLAAREPVALRRFNTVRIEIPRTSTVEQIEVWRHALPAGAFCPPELLEAVAAQFHGSWNTAEIVAATLRGNLAPGADPAEVGRALHDACRTGSRRRLDSMAARISSTVGWDDLVVPAHTSKPLREIAGQLRHRAQVYEGWGFADRSDRGLGVSALFHGDSGTGKTMAAEVIANELALDLYRVDLSRVVSKYIGETEKNLRRVFDAAEESGAILLFDEADALFGKRSEVKDSHDRYANVEVSYLLSRMETYRGLAILTTNFRQALDTAFMRRIRFVVHFPFPDISQRAAIWSRAFPSRTPIQNLNPAILARLAVTGGSIRNIAIAAAFLAADEHQAVNSGHILQAAVTEYGKLNKSLTDAETRGWQ